MVGVVASLAWRGRLSVLCSVTSLITIDTSLSPSLPPCMLSLAGSSMRTDEDEDEVEVEVEEEEEEEAD